MNVLKKYLPRLKYQILPISIIGVVAFIMGLASLKSGFTLDDYVLRWNSTRIVGMGFSSKIFFDIFRYFDQSRMSADIISGNVPWMTSGNLSLSHFRPITALSVWIDHVLWLDSSVMRHFHSVILYVLLCISVYFFYRRFIKSSRALFIAAILFTIDFNHFTLVNWISDRSRVLVLLFSVIALIFHDLWRKKKRLFPYGLIAVCFYMFGLLSSEVGICILFYLIAYELFMTNGSKKDRLISLFPYVAILLLWRVVSNFMGYKIAHSGFYTDPTIIPLEFLKEVVVRTPILFLEQWFNVSMFLPVKYWAWVEPSLLSVLSPAAIIWYIIVSVLSVIIVIWTLIPLLKKSAVARFFFLGMCLSFPFASATSIVSGRLLIFTGLGAFGLLGLLIDKLSVKRGITLYLLLLLILIHGVLSPLAFTVYGMIKNPSQVDLENSTNFPFKTSVDKSSVVLTAPSIYQFYGRVVEERYDRKPLPAWLTVLSAPLTPVKITRTAENSIVMSFINGSLPHKKLRPVLHKSYEYDKLDRTFYRDLSHISNTEVNLPHITLKPILTKDLSRISTLQVVFNDEAESRLDWYIWNWKTKLFNRFGLPKMGKSIILEGPFDR